MKTKIGLSIEYSICFCIISLLAKSLFCTDGECLTSCFEQQLTCIIALMTVSLFIFPESWIFNPIEKNNP